MVFTFHYVSIKSVKEGQGIPCWVHLHSTMYLLNLYRAKNRLSVRANLHSTMYLLNHLEQKIEGDDFDIYIPLCIY